MRRYRLFLTILLSTILVLSFSSPVLAADTITVTTTAYTLDGTDGECSLREAIDATNSNTTVNECIHDGSTGTDTIEFSIGAVGSLQTISLNNRIFISDTLILDGTTQSATSGCENMATPLIVIDGTSAGSRVVIINGAGSGTTVRGLVINNSSTYAVEFLGASNSRLQCSFVGTDTTGTAAVGNSQYGIVFSAGANNNFLGTDGDGLNDASEGNIISGNQTGIRFGGNSFNNRIAGNLIGTDINGTSPIPNTGHGIVVFPGRDNIIGTDGDGVSDTLERNIISGNGGHGIRLTNSGTTGNIVAGNYIGTDITGTAPLGNNNNGVRVENDASDNIIGTNGDGNGDSSEGNIIAANQSSGVLIDDAGSTDNVVAGNTIGLDVSGASILANSSHGVSIIRGLNNIIGTNGDGIGDADERNLISGNDGSGVFLHIRAADNRIAGNYIGTDATGTVDLGNGNDGIRVQNGSNNNIIGTNGDGNGDANEGNIISGNSSRGVHILTATATANIVAGNFIGTDATGTVDLGNDDDGVLIEHDSKNNIIGTNGDGIGDTHEGNLISGNGNRGIFMTRSETSGNVVAGNLIGTDVSGTFAIGNDSYGILLLNSTYNNRIGTNGDGVSDARERNIISGNNAHGIRLDNQVNNTVIAGNYIGTNLAGTAAIPNNGSGIQLRCTVFDNLIGTNGDGVNDTVERNLISGNDANGILADCQANANTIAGNFIGTASDRLSAIPNGGNGIHINNANGPFLIGGDIFREANLIAHNTLAGIVVEGGAQNASTISHNLIGTNSTLADLSNGTDGIYLAINNNGIHDIHIDNNLIFYHVGTGISLNGFTELGAQGVSVNNCVVNNGAGVDNTTSIPVFFEDNWWGAVYGPSGVASGSGDSVSIDVDYDPFTTIAPNPCLIPIQNVSVEATFSVFDPAISKIGFLLPGQVGVTGEQLEWIVTVSNTGNVVGTNVIVSDTLVDALQIDSVDAPNGNITISGQTVTVIYPTLNIGETVQFSIFTTVLDGVAVENTACVNADNQGAEECATGTAVGELPQTGEVPFWQNWLMGILLTGSGIILTLAIFPRVGRYKSS